MKLIVLTLIVLAILAVLASVALADSGAASWSVIFGP
jgi:hypothetical protein